MTDTLIALAVVGSWSFVMWLACRIGERWIEKMLHFEQPDPNKPIVRRLDGER